MTDPSPAVAALDAEIEHRHCLRGEFLPPCADAFPQTVQGWCTPCVARAYQAATRAALLKVEQERDELNEAVTEACKDRDYFDDLLDQVEAALKGEKEAHDDCARGFAIYQQEAEWREDDLRARLRESPRS